MHGLFGQVKEYRLVQAKLGFTWMEIGSHGRLRSRIIT
jgi:hypothetical protein